MFVVRSDVINRAINYCIKLSRSCTCMLGTRHESPTQPRQVQGCGFNCHDPHALEWNPWLLQIWPSWSPVGDFPFFFLLEKRKVFMEKFMGVKGFVKL